MWIYNSTPLPHQPSGPDHTLASKPRLFSFEQPTPTHACDWKTHNFQATHSKYYQFTHSPENAIVGRERDRRAGLCSQSAKRNATFWLYEGNDLSRETMERLARTYCLDLFKSGDGAGGDDHIARGIRPSEGFVGNAWPMPVERGLKVLVAAHLCFCHYLDVKAVVMKKERRRKAVRIRWKVMLSGDGAFDRQTNSREGNEIRSKMQGKARRSPQGCEFIHIPGTQVARFSASGMELKYDNTA